MSSSSTVTVTNAAQLQAALNSAHSGETILLASGNYGALNLDERNFSGAGVTIAAASATTDAEITGLHISTSSGITLSGLDLNLSGATGTPSAVYSSSNITLTNLNVHGSTSVYGLMAEGDTGLKISNSTFSNLANGIGELNNNNVSITNNKFTGLKTDGIDNGGSSNVTISGNSFTNFNMGTSTDHPDAIQFWTSNTTQSASNIVITNNTIAPGTGNQVQGIFMTDQVGDLPYQNVTISGNTITAEAWNGLVVSDAQNVTVSNNTVIGLSNTNVTLQANNNFGNSSTSWIELQDVAGLNLTGNNGSAYILAGNTSVNQSGNALNGIAQTQIMYSNVSASLGNLSTTLVFTGNAIIAGSATVAGQTIVANSGSLDRLYDSSAGHDTLIGGSGVDNLISQNAGDTLTAGSGATYFDVYSKSGNTTITNFERPGSVNTLVMTPLLANGAHAILTNSGDNTIISFSSGSETITLLGVHANQLHATSTGFHG